MRALILLLLFSFNLSAKVNYEYKKYEKFDFETLDVAGDQSSPGDISVSQRFKRKFKNKIPLRKNFNQEMAKAIDTIK